MKRLLLLAVIAGLLVLSGCASVEAQSQQSPPAAGKIYVAPAKIQVLNEAMKAPSVDEAKALEDLANRNECVKMIKTPDGVTVFLVFCGTPQEPYCPPPKPGMPRICY